MNTNELKNFFVKCELNPPVEEILIEKVQEKFKIKFPESYIEFLQFSNGCEGVLCNGSYVQMWKVEELVEFNNRYEVKECAPEMILIGSDGGNEAIGIDLRDGSSTFGSYYRVPFILLNWSDAKLLGLEITKIKIV